MTLTSLFDSLKGSIQKRHLNRVGFGMGKEEETSKRSQDLWRVGFGRTVSLA